MLQPSEGRLQLSQERLSALCWRHLLWDFFEIRKEITCKQLTRKFRKILEISTPGGDKVIDETITIFCKDFHKAINALPNPYTELKMEDKSLRNTLAFIISIQMMKQESPGELPWWIQGPGEQRVADFANKAKIEPAEALEFFNQLSMLVPRF